MKERKLAKGDDEATIVIESSITGKELNVSLIQGNKESYLFGYKEIAKALGYKDGDRGKVGIFKFNYLSPETFEATKSAASRLSNKTIRDMMNGVSPKFAKRNVKNIIRTGIKEGKPATDIAAELSKFFDDTKFWKVAEIVRTEIPKAYNIGRINAARTDGIKKAKIELGAKPCQWCVDNSPDVRTLRQAEEYMNAHHVNNNCTVIPLIDFSYYGIKPPPGYLPSEKEGPLLT